MQWINNIGNPNKMAFLFGFQIVQFYNGWDHSCTYCYNQPFQNWTIGNPNFKMFGIPMFGIQALAVLYFVLNKGEWERVNLSIFLRILSRVWCLILTWRSRVDVTSKSDKFKSFIRRLSQSLDKSCSESSLGK